MRLIRLAGLALIAVMAMSFAVVSSASAFSSNPLFTPANNQTVRGEGGPSTLKSGIILISCTENHVVGGNVSNGLLIGAIVIHYLGCVTPTGETGNGCEASSRNSAAGLIVTETLHAILGLLLPSNETGILFLPQTGSVFTTFASSACIPESKVSGTVAALISPAGSKQTTGKVKVFPSGTAIDLTHGLGKVTAKLVAFSQTSELTQEDNVVFGEATEVT